MAGARQSAIGRGMGGTSIVPSMQASLLRRRGEAMSRNEAALAGQRNAADMNITQNQIGFMERRTDGYPDAGMFAQAMSAAGDAAGARGGGGGGRAVSFNRGGGRSFSGPSLPSRFNSYHAEAQQAARARNAARRNKG